MLSCYSREQWSSSRHEAFRPLNIILIYRVPVSVEDGRHIDAVQRDPRCQSNPVDGLSRGRREGPWKQVDLALLPSNLAALLVAERAESYEAPLDQV